MPGKTLLFLSANNFYASIWKDGQLSAPMDFADSAQGREQFAAFLQVNRNPAYLLTDFIEEDFRHETVPHLRGGERSALLLRKFEQYYRSTPFRLAVAFHRQAEGRRDDEVLFSALTNPALIQPWLATLQATSTPLVGIYSVPNISAPLVKDTSSDHLLLLSYEKRVGLRQTYFDAKHLRFSRLTPINTNRTFSDTVAEETARTHQYLKSLSLLPQGLALDVRIICHVSDQRELAAHLRDSADVRHTYLDIQQVCKQFRSAATCTDSDATPLFLHLLATSPPRHHYANSEHTHFFQLYRLRNGLFGLSAALAATSLVWASVNLWQGGQLSADSVSLKKEAASLAQQVQQINQNFPHTVATAADMKTAVLLLRKLRGYSPPPQNILEGLSLTLDAFPRIRVDKLAWQKDSGLQEADGTALPAQIILLDGELTEFSGDYRNALDYLERFQQALSDRGHSVTALSMPLDVSAKGSISNTIAEGKNKPAAFSLKIIWRPRA